MQQQKQSAWRKLLAGKKIMIYNDDPKVCQGFHPIRHINLQAYKILALDAGGSYIGGSLELQSGSYTAYSLDFDKVCRKFIDWRCIRSTSRQYG